MSTRWVSSTASTSPASAGVQYACGSCGLSLAPCTALIDREYAEPRPAEVAHPPGADPVVAGVEGGGLAHGDHDGFGVVAPRVRGDAVAVVHHDVLRVGQFGQFGEGDSPSSATVPGLRIGQDRRSAKPSACPRFRTQSRRHEARRATWPRRRPRRDSPRRSARRSSSAPRSCASRRPARTAKRVARPSATRSPRSTPTTRRSGEGFYGVVTSVAPDLVPETYYGMPGYASAEGKIVVFLRPAGKFKARYATIGFEDRAAHLDDGDPVAGGLRGAPVDARRRGDGRRPGPPRRRLTPRHAALRGSADLPERRRPLRPCAESRRDSTEMPSGVAGSRGLGGSRPSVEEVVACDIRVRPVAHPRVERVDAGQAPPH